MYTYCIRKYPSRRRIGGGACGENTRSGRDASLTGGRVLVVDVQTEQEIEPYDSYRGGKSPILRKLSMLGVESGMMREHEVTGGGDR